MNNDQLNLLVRKQIQFEIRAFFIPRCYELDQWDNEGLPNPWRVEYFSPLTL